MNHEVTLAGPDVWKAAGIRHSINGSVRLHVRPVGPRMEIVLTGPRADGKLACPGHDLLDGEFSELVYEQNRTAIAWVDDIANAINASRGHGGFSRAARRLLPGTWISDDLRLTFDSDESYALVERKVDRSWSGLRGIAPSGTWSAASNMLCLLKNGEGERIQLVNVTNTRLLLPGEHGALRYVRQRAG
jgi:hypothetical protein